MWSRGQSDPPESQQTKISCNIILHFKVHPWIPSSNGEWLHRSGDGHTGHLASYTVIPRWILRSREHSGKPKLHNKKDDPGYNSSFNSQLPTITENSYFKVENDIGYFANAVAIPRWLMRSRERSATPKQKKQKLSSEIRYQFKSELSSPSSCGERSKTSWQVKTDFFMILNLILDLFFEKKLENGP